MGTGKKKIEIKKIENPSSRMITFSKRRKGLFKKADDFRAKTSGKIAVVVISSSGKPYPHGDIEELSTALSSSFGYIPRYAEAFMGNGDELKCWLNEIRVDHCDLVQSQRLKKQLLDVKGKIVKAVVESWTL